MESFRYEDEFIRNSIGDLSPAYNPADLFPNLLDSNLTTSPPSEQAKFTFFLSGDDAAHIENLLYWGIDSPVLPPDIIVSLQSAAEAAPDIMPTLSGLPDISDTPDITPSPTTSSSVGPITTYADPETARPTSHTRGSSLRSPKEPEQSTQGPSVPRPAKRAHTFYPGESLFRLDPTVPPLKPSETPGQSKNGAHVHPKYPLCRCPLGPTRRPPRHWDVCPSNPEGRKRLFPCEICGRPFTVKWNKDRHVKSCIRRGS